MDDAVTELAVALKHLERCGVTIGSLALLGGEATLAKSALRGALEVAGAANNVQAVELVTNGLTPRGVAPDALTHVNRVSLSDYTHNTQLADAWTRWLAAVAPHVELVRRQHDQWDRWTDPVDLGVAGGQAAYDTCWYRRHCVTLERGHLFVCSRIPKLGADDQALALTATTTLADIESHLTAPVAPASCRTCTPMAGLPGVAAGIQPDDRLPRLTERALAWFSAQAGAQ